MNRGLGTLVLLIAFCAVTPAAVLNVPGEYPTIQGAIDASAPLDEIVIAAGTYDVTESHVVPTGNLTFRAAGDVILTGSSGAFFHVTAQTHYNVPVRFEGFRFEANDIAISTRYPEAPFNPTHVEIADCVFAGSQGYAIGGRNVGELVVTGCRFEGDGDALYSLASGLEMRDCMFEGQDRVALRFEDEGIDPRLVENCLFVGNRATVAVVAADYSHNLTFRHCTIADCGVPGGSVFRLAHEGDMVLDRCIVVISAGRVFECTTSSSDFFVLCSDIWDNAEGDWSDCAVGEPDQNGNFTADPLFCNPNGGEYTLDTSSPCAPENNACGQTIGAYGVDCGTTGVGVISPDESSLSAVKRLY